MTRFDRLGGFIPPFLLVNSAEKDKKTLHFGSFVTKCNNRVTGMKPTRTQVVTFVTFVTRAG